MQSQKAISKQIEKSKMVTEQDTLIQAIPQATVEAARVVLQAIAVLRTEHNDRMHNVVPKIGRPIMQ